MVPRSRCALALAALALLAPGSALAAKKNSDFRGHWHVSSGGDFVIKHEDAATGTCSGTSAFAGYKLVDCHVNGDKYRFVVTQGPGYRSYNSGTFHGTRLTGAFHDTNGTREPYTATRKP